MYMYIRVCVFICVSACVHVNTFVRVHVHVRVYVRVRVRTWFYTASKNIVKTVWFEGNGQYASKCSQEHEMSRNSSQGFLCYTPTL